MPAKAATLKTEERSGALTLAFAGRLDAEGAGALWGPVLQQAAGAKGRPLAFDLGEVSSFDTAGAAILAAAEVAHGGEAARIDGARDEMEKLLARARQTLEGQKPPSPPVPRTIAEIGAEALRAAADAVAFLGEAAIALVVLPRRRRMLRRAELLNYADQAGVRALPLVGLLGFLIGMILAFQSAIPMRRFGADLYVANLVAISLLRELGPLMAAVILSGRTGSAFAAEIGTMKVNEEIDALRTMGLDPMTMLVLPRLIAAVAVMPVLTVALNIAGLAGMTAVMMGFGFPFVAIAHQVSTWVTPRDLFGGLFKAACFGAVIAAIGCREGLGTGVGPRAVGLSATGAVVGGIVATILLDGVFALVFYRLGL